MLTLGWALRASFADATALLAKTSPRTYLWLHARLRPKGFVAHYQVGDRAITLVATGSGRTRRYSVMADGVLIAGSPHPLPSSHVTAAAANEDGLPEKALAA
jgi:hypothetical protein